jgi:hypothetical protein
MVVAVALLYGNAEIDSSGSRMILAEISVMLA